MREQSLHILDVLVNSLEAGATCIELTIEEDLTTDRLTITVRDNGRGMDEAQLSRILDPFYTTRKVRHVGLGLPLFKAAAERCNGNLTVTSQPGQGTTVQAIFQHSHIDRAPLGNLTGTLVRFVVSAKCDMHYVHRVSKTEDEEARVFEFSTADIKAELGGAPLTHIAVQQWLHKFIAEGEAELTEVRAASER
jgi:hypothetical protein